jgi:hypothetical protein
MHKQNTPDQSAKQAQLARLASTYIDLAEKTKPYATEKAGQKATPLHHSAAVAQQQSSIVGLAQNAYGWSVIKSTTPPLTSIMTTQARMTSRNI